MPTWSKLSAPRAIYISPSFYVSNDLDRYVADIKETTINIHGQKIEYFYRTSYNQLDWSKWEKFYTISHDFLNENTLSGLYVQFQVAITTSHLNLKPYLQSLSVDLKPYSYVGNTGDKEILPKIWIKKKNGKGDIVIINFTTGQRVEFKDIDNNEEIYVDCENEEIVSSNQHLGIYRYDNHNDEYLELARGDNYITSIGDFDFDIRYKAILLQE